MVDMPVEPTLASSLFPLTEHAGNMSPASFFFVEARSEDRRLTEEDCGTEETVTFYYNSKNCFICFDFLKLGEEVSLASVLK